MATFVGKGRPAVGANGCGSTRSAGHLDPVGGDDARRAAALRIVSLLGDLSKEDSEELVLGVLRSFSRRVYDLPASERHHHHGRWGLLDHSLEVAEYALRASLGANFMESVAPHPEVHEFRLPRLRYATFLFGLFHDAGKILGVSVKSGHRDWNPFSEDLADFLDEESGPAPSVFWRAGRGMDAHDHHLAYLLGIFIPGAVADYLSAPLLAELLERRSAAAIRVFDLVAQADQRSAKEDMVRQEKEKETSNTVTLAYPELSVGYQELVPKAFVEGLREGLFSANIPDGDLWIGREYVALRYPSAVGKLAGIVRERLGPASQKARMLPSGDAGARDLANHLSELDLIFRDTQTGSWKVQMSVALEGSFQATAAILFKRVLLFPQNSAVPAPELFPGEATFSRPSDHSALGIPGFREPSPSEEPRSTGHAPGVPSVAKSEILRTLPHERNFKTSNLPEEAPPAPVVASPVKAACLRETPLPDVLLEDIRTMILEGKILVNRWNAQVYVLPDRTYFVTPSGFRKMVELGLYRVDPSTSNSLYLNTLAKLDCVRKHGNGRVVSKMRLRENTAQCAVVTFETHGLFRTEEEIARVGFWTETDIVDVPLASTPPPAEDEEEAGDD